jgi:hypothetical protein
MLRRGRGRRGPGVIGTMARTAAIAGTATAVSGNVARRQQASAQHAADAEAYRRQQTAGSPPAEASPAAVPASPARGSSEHVIAQLKELAALKEQGILTDEEFAAQKARLLG